MHVAVVGSGPAGFYAAEALLQSGLPLEVDMIERLPVPFGLVRHGVAPDHQKLKGVTSIFEAIAGEPNFHFLGNIELGRDVDIAQLRASYDAVVLATGADLDQPLGVAGEHLPGSVSATAFVGWYNGHPDFQDQSFDLSRPTAVVIGNGNVALDIVRILSKTVDELKDSDICAHALAALAASRVTEIVLVGRRGPAQMKFTAKELREFGDLCDAEPVVDAQDLQLDAASQRELEGVQGAVAARNVAILRSFSARSTDRRGSAKRIHFRFMLAPTRVEGSEKVERVVFRRTRLTGAPFAQRATLTDEEVGMPAGLVVRSVGYRGRPIPGVPFDAGSGTIPHIDGRVCDASGALVPGLYVAGWIKRGPNGVIGTNRACGVDTSDAVLSDLRDLQTAEHSGGQRRRDAFLHSMRGRSPTVVDFAGWRRIDAAERQAGEARGKPREKMTSVHAMIAASEEGSAP